MGINLLNDTGKMVQLIPSNVYKNVFAESLRKLLSPNLSVVLEYPTQKMFGETLTSSSIFLFDKLCTTEFIKYKNVTKNFTANISRQLLVGKWVFEKQTPLKNKVIRFGDCFHASIAVATLLNKAFVICKNSIDENPIEATLLRNAAAPKAMRYNREEYIIFPYYYEGMELKRYSSEKFEKMFPLATKHLKKYKTKLEKRNKDKKAKWFEYGRSQALAHLNQEKLLLSTVITNKVELYTLDSKTIPYSGIYITKKNSQYTLETAIEILQSQQFLEYVKRIGISVSGESMRITCKDINNFCFEVDKYGTAEICN